MKSWIEQFQFATPRAVEHLKKDYKHRKQLKNGWNIDVPPVFVWKYQISGVKVNNLHIDGIIIFLQDTENNQFHLSLKDLLWPEAEIHQEYHVFLHDDDRSALILIGAELLKFFKRKMI